MDDWAEADRPENRASTGGDIGEAGIVVQKFGGTSLGDADKLRSAAKCVATAHLSGNPTVVVVSARGNATDELLDVAGAVGGSDPELARETDQLLATGEYASAALMAMAVHRAGVPAISLTGVQAGIRVRGRHGAGVITGIDTERVRELLTEGRVVVIGGFHGGNQAGDVVTLGRGGSDTTAVALAVALRAVRCEIYTDVDGIYTADPRLVPSARPLSEVDSHMMAEMAFSGAKVLHSRAVDLLAMRDMELRVRNSLTGSAGTLVSFGGRRAELEAANAVVAITHDFDVARLLVRAGRDVATDVLAVLAARAIPVDLVARSGVNEEEFRMGFTLRRGEAADIESALREALATAGADLRVDDQVAKVSLIGMGLLNRPEYAARMVAALSAVGVPTGWIWTSQLRVSVIVPLASGTDAVTALHREFELDRDGHTADSLATA